MDLFQPYMQLRFMSNAPIRTKIITNTYIRETALVQYELLSQTVQNSWNILYKPIVEYTLSRPR